MKLSSAQRWLLVPVACVAGFVAALALAVPLHFLLHAVLWSTGHPLPGKVFLLLQLPFDGALAAFLVVTLGSLMTPNRRAKTSLLIFFCGAIIAWFLIGNLRHPLEATRIWSSIIGTYLGGLLGVLCTAIRERRQAGEQHTRA